MVNLVLEQRQAVTSKQHQIIKETAKKSDCIIVWNCAEHVLQDCNPFRIFVYADIDSKMKRCREKASDKESMTDIELKHQIISVVMTQ